MLAQSIQSSVPTIEVDGVKVAFYPHAEHGFILRAIDLTKAVFAHRSDSYRRKLGDYGATLFRGTGFAKSHPTEPDPWCLSVSDARTVLRHISETTGMRMNWSGHAQLMLLAMQMVPEIGGSQEPPARPTRIVQPAEQAAPASRTNALEECLSIARRIHAAPAPIRTLALELIELRSPADAALIRSHIRRQRFSFAGVREMIGSAFGRGAGVIS